MDRRSFIYQSALLGGGTTMLSLAQLSNILSGYSASEKMPVLFIGHGNPMNAILDNPFSQSWKELGKSLPVPKAILSISAHWLTRGSTKVSVAAQPQTIHDFGGFPQKLFDQQYPAPGSPEFARLTVETVKLVHMQEDPSRGLDHGTWSVLLPMFPEARIPVFQISLDFAKPASFHFQLGKELQSLRKKGVLILGSGNLVHNLGLMRFQSPAYEWAQEFDSVMTKYIRERDFLSAQNYEKLGSLATLAHPTTDHLLPLFYTLGLVENSDTITWFNEAFDLGSVSMRSFIAS